MKAPWYGIHGSKTYFANAADLTTGGIIPLTVACPRECGRRVEQVTPIFAIGSEEVSYFLAHCPCGAEIKIVNDAGVDEEEEAAWERSRYPAALRDIDG